MKLPWRIYFESRIVAQLEHSGFGALEVMCSYGIGAKLYKKRKRVYSFGDNPPFYDEFGEEYVNAADYLTAIDF